MRVCVLGRPLQVILTAIGMPMPFDAKIADVFDDGDHVAVETSIGMSVESNVARGWRGGLNVATARP